MENLNELSLKLKNGVIDLLMTSPRDIDAVYMCCGIKTYSRRELAEEIKNETEVGLEMLTSSMLVSIDQVARNSTSDKK